MHKSNAITFSLLSGVSVLVLGGLAIAWNVGQPDVVVDARVEKACHREVEKKSPLGHRGIISYGYDEDGPTLGVLRGGHEAQYARNKWTQVAWTCRVNPRSQEIIRVEVQPTNGGAKLKAAATAF